MTHNQKTVVAYGVAIVTITIVEQCAIRLIANKMVFDKWSLKAVRFGG